MWDLIVSVPDHCLYFYFTCIASDIRDRVRERGHDNVISINTGSGVRRIIIKRPQCMYKSEQRYMMLTRKARPLTHTAFVWLILKRS